ncbi:MAG: hypothetical protein ACYDEV_10930 [Acidiferrobacter sp.]
MHINRPTADPTMAVGLQTTSGALAAYLAFVPLKLRLYEQTYNAVFASFFTVSGDYRRHRLSDRQQLLMLDRARARGYDLYVAVTVAGTPANQTVARAFAARDLPVHAVRNFRYLAGVAEIVTSRLAATPVTSVRRYERRDEERALALLSQTGAAATIAKVVECLDVDFMLRSRPRVASYVYERDGQVLGLLNFAFLPFVSGHVGVNAYVENIAFGDLSLAQRQDFVEAALRAVLEEGVEAIMVPDSGYADLEPFRRLGFRAAPRKLRLLLAPLRAGVLTALPEEIDSFCLDVF